MAIEAQRLVALVLHYEQRRSFSRQKNPTSHDFFFTISARYTASHVWRRSIYVQTSRMALQQLAHRNTRQHWTPQCAPNVQLPAAANVKRSDPPRLPLQVCVCERPLAPQYKRRCTAHTHVLSASSQTMRAFGTERPVGVCARALCAYVFACTRALFLRTLPC